MQKTLYILRHAQAKPLANGQEDQDRRLTARGVDEAQRMGEYLAAQGISPEQVLCSTAVRCRETAAAIFPSPTGRRWRAAPDEGRATKSMPNMLQRPHPDPLPEGEGISDCLYLASPNRIIALLKEVPENIHSLMVIGHNPGLHELCMTLAKDGDNALRRGIAAGFPTCALATLAFDGAWQNVGRVPVTLAGFITPKML